MSTRIQDQVESIYSRTQGRRTKEAEFNIYGIVLGFTVPKLTRKGDWMMQVTLTDDSLNECNGESNSQDPISTLSITLFNKNKDSLPRISCAGDIIRCHRIVSNKWHDSMQLNSLKWSTNTTVNGRRDNDGHIVWRSDGCKKTPLAMSRVKELWEYGQSLFSKQSAVNRAFRIMIENVEIVPESNNDPRKDYGDMIAMVANVIPFPISLQSPTSPRGFIRAWDGTGPSSTDP